MKKEDISDALGKIGDEMLLAANEKRKKQKPRWAAWAAAAACLCLIVALAVPALKPAPVGAAGVIAEAEYPEMAQYPIKEDAFDWNLYDSEEFARWSEARGELRACAKASDEGVNAFCKTTIPQFLSGAGEENRVYSPINVYMALAMLAELTDGNSRAQILELLDAEDTEALRAQAQNIWKANYCDDGTVTSVLANSLWLNENVTFRQDTMDRLAQTYYASSYQGTMGAQEFDELLQNWLNEQTGGLLEEQAKELELDADTVLALASTVYFRGKWADTFDESKTVPDTFYAPDGEKTVDFMKQEMEGTVCWGENFTAVKLAIQQGGAMWLILPDEGYSVDEVLANDETLAMVTSNNWSDCKSANIRLSMPKFDVVSQMDLVEGLQELGITDVFDYTLSDFTPTTQDEDELYVSEVNHAARVSVDEEGCTATAFTVMIVEPTSALIADEIDFVLDRPFVFVLTGVTDQPLFAGVVNQP